MDIRTYRATTMQEALARVRRDLGPQAVILHTRELWGSRWMNWIPGMRQIEVTASLEVKVPSRLPTRREAEEEEDAVVPDPATVAYEPEPRAATEQLARQLSHLQEMVENLCQRDQTAGRRDVPEQLFHLYADLIEAEFSEETARELVEWVRAEAPGQEFSEPDLLKQRLADLIEGEIPVRGPIVCEPGKRRVVAVVGPTGVGKTTTIAKLAANFRLRDKRKVGLITVDTYRIAAVEQLRTYADIIDLPMKVVAAPREMREAIQQFSDLDLVLVDTAGRSPRDEVKIQELKAFLGEAQVDETHLVLSSAAGSASLQRTAERFAEVGAGSLILTKLDEASGLGNLLPLARTSGLPLSYVTNGQQVPDDIEAADARRLARLMLNMDAESGTRCSTRPLAKSSLL